MIMHFTLEYWIEENWFVGRLKEIPGVFSQGETLEELEENIRDACKMMIDEVEPVQGSEIHIREIGGVV